MALGFLCSAIAHRTNPLFVQERTGKGGTPFKFYKIRSMHDEIDGADNTDEARLTHVGSLLRRASIDEIPQVFNILRGDMSFVGPRPQMHSYYDLMSESDQRRYDTRPGLSGWSQVNGRNGVTWKQRFAQDIWYIENMCWRLDLWILWRTFVVVLTGSGVSSATCATMQPLTDELRGDQLTDWVSDMPSAITDIVTNSTDAVVTFSLHDPDNLHPATVDPRDIFVFDVKSAKTISYHNVYLDVWRRPLISETAFPVGTVGPLNVEVSQSEIAIADTAETMLHQNLQKKPALFEASI